MISEALGKIAKAQAMIIGILYKRDLIHRDEAELVLETFLSKTEVDDILAHCDSAR